MGGSNEDFFHKIFFLGSHADLAAASTMLAAVKTNGIPLNVTLMRYGYHHILLNNHILDVNVILAADYLCSSLISVSFFRLFKLFNNDTQYPLRVGKYASQP